MKQEEIREGIQVLDTLDKRIERLAQQVGDLMEQHNRLVKEGKLPAYELMGLHNT